MSRAGRWVALAAAALLGGCAAHRAGVRDGAMAKVAATQPGAGPTADADYPTARGDDPIGGFRTEGPARPEGKRLAVDVDGLPSMTWRDPPSRRGFSIVATGDAWLLRMRAPLLAEAIVYGRPSYEGSSAVIYSGFTGGTFWQGDASSCGSGVRGEVPARWSGFSPKNWTDEGIDVEVGEGELTLATCRGRTLQFASGRAAALVNGFVYGLRVTRPSGTTGPSETLYLFLPRASQVAASSDPGSLTETADAGSFTRLSFVVTRGKAAAASVRLSAAALRMWSALRARGSPVPGFEDTAEAESNLLLDVDVSAVDDTRMLASLSFSVPAGVDAKPYAKLLAAVKTVANR